MSLKESSPGTLLLTFLNDQLPTSKTCLVVFSMTLGGRITENLVGKIRNLSFEP